LELEVKELKRQIREMQTTVHPQPPPVKEYSFEQVHQEQKSKYIGFPQLIDKKHYNSNKGAKGRIIEKEAKAVYQWWQDNREIKLSVGMVPHFTEALLQKVIKMSSTQEIKSAQVQQ
jgi:hypothetical protein